MFFSAYGFYDLSLYDIYLHYLGAVRPATPRVTDPHNARVYTELIP